MYLAAFAILVVAALVQSSVGFGANLIAMPTIALVEPDLVPGAALLAGGIMNLLMLWRDRDGFEIAPVSDALIGRVFGTGLGLAVLLVVSERGLGIVIALAVFAMVAASMSTLAPVRSRRNMIAAGTVSGFTASTAGIGGPPVVLMFQRETGRSIRGCMAAFFLVGTTMTLAGLAIVGEFSANEALWGVALLPASVIGFLLSGPMLPFVDRGWIRPAILLLSTSAAIVLLLRAI